MMEMCIIRDRRHGGGCRWLSLLTLGGGYYSHPLCISLVLPSFSPPFSLPLSLTTTHLRQHETGNGYQTTNAQGECDSTLAALSHVLPWFGPMVTSPQTSFECLSAFLSPSVCVAWLPRGGLGGWRGLRGCLGVLFGDGVVVAMDPVLHGLRQRHNQHCSGPVIGLDPSLPLISLDGLVGLLWSCRMWCTSLRSSFASSLQVSRLGIHN